MVRVMCAVCYDGADFFGFQSQPSKRNIQDEIQKALSQICKTDMLIIGSGRTDAGVHANGQVFHFDTTQNMSERQWKLAINRLLPKDIHITSAHFVNNDFHSRFSAIEKTYYYKINVGEYNPLQCRYVYQFNRNVDIVSMKRVAKLFEGEHNFWSFCSHEAETTNSFLKTIKKVQITKKNDVICITIIGTGFLRYMVRMIVGTLLEIGLGKIDDKYILEHLDQEVRQIVAYKVPGCGLYLDEVRYEGDKDAD